MIRGGSIIFAKTLNESTGGKGHLKIRQRGWNPNLQISRFQAL